MRNTKTILALLLALLLLLCLFPAAALAELGAVNEPAQETGVSGYTVEFTYQDAQYVLPGDDSVALAEILQTLGLAGEVSAVEVSDSALFSASDASGAWVVTSHQAFTSTEWMKVTVDGTVYEIVVTDRVNNVDDNYTLPSAITGTNNSLVKNKLNILYYLNGSYVGKTQLDRSKNTSSANFYYTSSINSHIQSTTWVENGCTYLINYYFNVKNDYPYAKGTFYTPTGTTYTAYSQYNFANGTEDGQACYWGRVDQYNVMTVNLSNPSYTVTITGGENATTSGGATTQTVSGAMTTVTYTANSGYQFNSFSDITNNGITAKRTDATTVTVSGTPTADASITVPNAAAIPATAPTFSTTDATLTYGYASGSVSVTATPASGHTITGYQWYDNGTTNGNSGGTVISGATDASYAIPTGKAVGTYYNYCVVTTERTDNSQTATTTSNAIAVTVAAPVASVTVGETTTNYTAFSDALSAWEDGSTLTLLDDVTTASTITVSGTKTLDLNGCGVRMTGSGRVFEVPSGATLTINDSGSSRVHYVTLTNWRGAAVSDTGTESDVTDGSGVVKVTGGYITGGYITSYNGSALHVSGTLNLVKRYGDWQQEHRRRWRYRC